MLSQGAQGATVTYSYDTAGNLSKLTCPSGRTVDYTYDAAGQSTKLSTAGVDAATFSYNGKGLLTTTALPNGVTDNEAYNGDGQLTSSELINGTTSLYKKTRTYDAIGNVTQTGTSANGAAATLQDFVYDPISRLTGQNADGTNQSLNAYTYNSVGNLTGINSSTQTYDTAGKLTGTGSQTLAYDGRNNRTGLADSTTPSNNVEYSWTPDNMLASVTTHTDTTTGTSTTVSYTYGANNLLQNRGEGTTTDTFVWDTNRAIPVMLTDGKYEYIYGAKDRTPLAQVETATGTVTYLHHDLNGSVTASTDSTGKLVGTVDYSPYGVATGPLLSRFGYAGEWNDTTTGYSYLRARWLDTKTGTFLSEDPLVQTTQNAYCYTNGNPITQVDPLGLWSSWGEFGMWAWSNAGNASAIVGGLGLILDATGVGAPVGLTLGAISLGLGIAGGAYDVGGCTGWVQGSGCNPGAIALDAIGILTGGGALAVGKLAAKSAKVADIKINLENASLLAGFSGATLGVAGAILNQINWSSHPSQVQASLSQTDRNNCK